MSLHCRAFGEPEPQIYWLLPSGHRFFPGTVSNKYNQHPEGTLEIYGATEQEVGLYTCTTHSLVGADLKNVTIAVGGYVPDPFKQPVNLNIRSVQTHSVLVFWENSDGWALSLITGWLQLRTAARRGQ